MADRYWVGGTGTWGSSQTTNWSAATGLSFTASCTGTTLTTVGSPALVAGMTVRSSTHVSLGTIVSGSVNTWVVSVGGTYTSQDMSAATVGASVPTAADNVFFDANSNSGTTAFTVTMANTPRVCNNFTASGLDGALTLAGTSIGLTVSGSLDWPATNLTRSYTGTTTFNATTTGKTITARVSFPGAVTFDGVGGAWTLGFDLVTLGVITVTNGTFDTSSSGNYAVTATSFSSTNSNVRTINLNASTVTLSAFPGWDITTSTNATVNAGTSTINLSAGTADFRGGGKTYYNVAFTNTSGGSQVPSVSGANTFNNLSLSGRTGTGMPRFEISANQTINGTFTVSAGTLPIYRRTVYSDTLGTPRTLTCAAVSLTDVDFKDITIAGAAAPASGTRLGDCKGNSGITFPAAKTVYYRQTGSANWGATGSGSWSATSGGALDATMFPLAQDTAVFPAATYPASGSTTTINDGYNIGTIDMSLRTSNTMTLGIGASSSLICFGDWINGTGITLTGTAFLTFSGRTTQQLTSANVTFTQQIYVDTPGGSVTLQDAFIQSITESANLVSGTLDLNGFTCTVGLRFATSSSTSARNLTFNGGTLVCPSANTTSFNNAAPTSFTTTAGIGTGAISMTAATAKTFVGAGSTFNCTINQGGAGALTITGSNTFSDITNTYSATGATSILFTAATTSTFTNWNASGESTRLLTIGSVTAASHTLSKTSGSVSADFLSISRSTAAGGASWYAGANSTDALNNSGWIFTAPPAGSLGGLFLAFF